MVALSSVIRAVSVPALAGFKIAKTIDFNGEAGKSVDTSMWEIMTEYVLLI